MPITVNRGKVMKVNEYKKILNYLNDELWDIKVTDTNWNYNGLILDRFFDMSVLSIDYLDLDDFFYSNGGFMFSEIEPLVNQYGDCEEEQRTKLIENILNILKQSTLDKKLSNNILGKVIKFLERHDIKVSNPSVGPMMLINHNIIGAGSYCIVKKYNQNIVRKELLSGHINDEKLQKRMKYEFENMLKLKDSPHVLKVYTYEPETYSYLMERAENNLYDYLNENVDITFSAKLKIVGDILKGMNFAHQNDIIHRDLHLGNVLKIRNDYVISDFGLSKDESIERSLKSSGSPKNYHSFMDPLGYNDFTKLDKKSDIYSLGKIIDYIFTYNTSESNHIFTFIVEKCTMRDKFKRYETIQEIIDDIKLKLEEQNQSDQQSIILEKIQKSVVDIQVVDFINLIVNEDSICKYIVKYKLHSFGEIIVKLAQIEQIKILQTINYGYSESTGFGRYENYDIFASIAFYVCKHNEERKVYSLAYNLLEGCARYRYKASDLLTELQNHQL